MEKNNKHSFKYKKNGEKKTIKTIGPSNKRSIRSRVVVTEEAKYYLGNVEKRMVNNKMTKDSMQDQLRIQIEMSRRQSEMMKGKRFTIESKIGTYKRYKEAEN